MTEAERRSALDAIGVEVAACTRCRLHETRTRSVPVQAAAEPITSGPASGQTSQTDPTDHLTLF